MVVTTVPGSSHHLMHSALWSHLWLSITLLSLMTYLPSCPQLCDLRCLAQCTPGHREFCCLERNCLPIVKCFQSMGDGFDSGILCDGKQDGECYGSWQIPGGQCVIVPDYHSRIFDILTEQECVARQTQYEYHVSAPGFCVEYFGFVLSLGL